MPASPPTVWFTRNISPTLHRIRQAARSGRYRVIASHVSQDAGYLGAAHTWLLEPRPVEPPAYLAYVLETVREFGVDALVAGRHLPLLAGARSALAEAGCRLIVPSRDPDSYELCEDKARFYQLFSGRIPMPDTRLVGSWEALEGAARELAGQYGSSCIKPARGIYGLGFRILTEDDDLKRFLGGDQLHLSYATAERLFKGRDLPGMLVMQTLPGTEYSVDALARGGELLTCVIRQKLGGLGNLQTAVDSPPLRAWTALLARELQMDGLFNAQFKEDAAGVPRLLEVNARASGGLPISTALSGLELGLLELDAHFGEVLGDLTFTPGKRVSEALEVIEVLALPQLTSSGSGAG
ncbi:hypothetical protein DKM44_00620 [Deinococcus irradiatisoli]|uniref:Carbamoyl phosphate synthase ATP-binding domain-containing protein n=1 Tax=Deinococcus irradiatisoli TaxID=2202254 RepID=A0A2Z3JKX3_9DEIO|nr:ATP-grasp domain-containing protein [Deinococcus irradiatisoli]AWN21924.1 hypothetical protein DKM44_00620 [Deinococcus irradiatisoli]